MTLPNLVPQYNSLDWPKLVLSLSSYASSERAREQLNRIGLFNRQEQAERAIAEVGCGIELLELDKRPCFESIDYSAQWMSRANKEATLDPLLLKDARLFFRESVAARTLLSEALTLGLSPQTEAWVMGLLSEIADFRSVLQQIDATISPAGEIREDASPTLSELYREKAQQIQKLQTTLDRLVRSHDMETFVQERFVTTREGRWVIPLKSGMRPFISGVVHGTSQTKQTVYLEPEETVPINNRLREIESEIEAEIERILVELSKKIFRLNAEIALAQQTLFQADLILAKAALARATSAHPPTFKDGVIDLKGLSNPIMLLAGKKTVANSVTLGTTNQKQVLLLSGPNAGGKTVLLKSIGLAALMAKAGLWIAADAGSEITFFEEIQSLIGDEQSVDQDLSTFAAHLKALDAATQLTGSRSLLLVDEICDSTDPEEGAALARAFIDHFIDAKIFCVLTSHLQSLKQGWAHNSTVLNGSLDFDSTRGQPTYQFVAGVAGQSLAIQTAERVGVRKDIIEKSLTHLSPETRARMDMIRELEVSRAELRAQRDSLVRETIEASQEKKKYKDLVQLFKSERTKWLERFIEKTERRIDKLISQYSVDQLFKKHERMQEIRSELPAIVKHKSGSNLIYGASTGSPQPQSAEEFSQRYPPGSKAYVKTLNCDGIIQAAPNSKGEVLVLAKSMRLTVPWNTLVAPHQRESQTYQALRRTSGITVTAVDTERVVDVRGLAPEDAIQLLERELDSALLADENRFRIIHGHGTETLKRAIRSFLSKSPSITSWKAGGQGSGGDGITHVIL